MRFLHPYVILTVASSSLVNAAPANRCNPVDAVYSLLKGPFQAEASKLCLAFLGGDKTVQQTQIQTTTGPGATITVTAAAQTATATAQTVQTVSVTETATVQLPDASVMQTVTVTAATSTVYQKREAMANPAGVPGPLAIFASSRISSACLCIVTPATRTITTTQTQSVAGPQITQTQPGVTVTVTVTTTSQTTVDTTITTTLDPSTTSTQTITTTVTPLLVKPKICNAKGLPSANAFNYDANFNTNQANCIASCKTDARCLSTGFYLVTDPSTGSQTGTCRKYDKSVTDSANLGAGYYNFNDKAC